MKTPGKFVFIRDFAEYFGVTTGYVHHLITRGVLQKFSIAELYEIDRDRAARLGRGKYAQCKEVVFLPDSAERGVKGLRDVIKNGLGRIGRWSNSC
jgi:hypothetical protein